MNRDEAPAGLADLAPADAPGPFQSGTIRVPLRGEELVTTKEVIVRSEVVIRKTPTTYREEITDTVRRSRVQVEEPRGGAGEARVVVREDRSPS